MSPKFLIIVGALTGSTIGAYIPALWGDTATSLSSILFSLIFGLGGIWLGYKISR